MQESKEILKSFMPKGFPIDRYNLKKIEKKKHEGINSDVYPYQLSYYFEEENIPPEGYTSDQLISKGFSSEKTISDLPIRDNFFSLKIKTRRWIDKATNKVITSEINIIEKGTRNTKELSFFLKEGERHWLNEGYTTST